MVNIVTAKHLHGHRKKFSIRMNAFSSGHYQLTLSIISKIFLWQIWAGCSPEDLVTVCRTGKRGKVLLVKTSHGLTFRKKTCPLTLSHLKQHVISLSLALKQSSELLLSRSCCKLDRVGLWELNCHYLLTLARAKAEI